MDDLELELDLEEARSWFATDTGSTWTVVTIPPTVAADWRVTLGRLVRQCYVGDSALEARVADGFTRSRVIAAVIPTQTNIMSGEFGEILAYVYQATQAYPLQVVGPLKWRLKNDKNQTTHYSDVVQFFLPQWPESTTDDELLCAEVKTKSGRGGSSPIEEALVDCEKDRIGRLVKTLVWLRDRAYVTDTPSVQVDQLTRFIETDRFPEARRRFSAVVVLCTSIAVAEMAVLTDSLLGACSLVIVQVPELAATWRSVYDRALGGGDPP